MPVYSFGADSPLKIEVTDEFAAAYNAATDDFAKAQLAFKINSGKEWTPEHPLYVRDESDEVFDTFAEILEKAVENYGRPIYEYELTDIHLIKN